MKSVVKKTFKTNVRIFNSPTPVAIDDLSLEFSWYHLRPSWKHPHIVAPIRNKKTMIVVTVLILLNNIYIQKQTLEKYMNLDRGSYYVVYIVSSINLEKFSVSETRARASTYVLKRMII